MAEENENGQEKQFDPTEQRRKEFRERGEVPRSREVTAVLSLSAASVCLLSWAGGMADGFAQVWRACYTVIPTHELDVDAVRALIAEVLQGMAMILGVPLGAMFMTVLVVETIQGRGAINSKDALQPKLEKLDPIKGFKQKFMSSQPLVEMSKGVVKLVVIGALIWAAMRDHVGMLPALVYQPTSGILAAYREIAVLVLTRALPVGIIIAVLDYGYQWYKMQEQMKMTREEMKEESKKNEGDPKLKGQRQRRMREIAMSQTLKNVAQADLIITNPTHFAIALRYRRDENPAPVVVAKGVDHLALKIRLEARRLDIPQVENRVVARGLFYVCKVGQPIPEEFYGPVARVIGVIAKRRRAVARRSRSSR